MGGGEGGVRVLRKVTRIIHTYIHTYTHTHIHTSSYVHTCFIYLESYTINSIYNQLFPNNKNYKQQKIPNHIGLISY